MFSQSNLAVLESFQSTCWKLSFRNQIKLNTAHDFLCKKHPVFPGTCSKPLFWQQTLTRLSVSFHSWWKSLASQISLFSEFDKVSTETKLSTQHFLRNRIPLCRWQHGNKMEQNAVASYSRLELFTCEFFLISNPFKVPAENFSSGIKAN